MATSINPWVFIVIGIVVGAWSYFDGNLPFFVIVGCAVFIYGVGKLIYLRVTSLDKSVQLNDGANAKSSINNHNKYVPQRMQQMQQMNSASNMSHQIAAHHSAGHHNTAHQSHSNSNLGHKNVTGSALNSSLHSTHSSYRICPNCKGHVHSTFRFCPHCGWGV